jgi:hypothetical protein
MVKRSVSFRCAALAAGLFFAVLNQDGAGAIISAASPALADVQAAVSAATDGDTVSVPAGTAHWASGLTITKGITLLGATSCDTSTALGTANDQTIILDDNTTTTVYPNTILNATLTQNQVFRLSGITFRGGTGNLVNAAGIQVGGIAPGASGTGSFRIDHCDFDSLDRNTDVQVTGWLYGVIDHCIFHAATAVVGVRVWHDAWGGGTNQYGDGSWAEDPYFGSYQFVFLEDNCFNNSTTNGDDGGTDAKNGARVVIRHNFFNNAVPTTHGTEAQRPRGTRVEEIYNNIVNYTFNYPGNQLRSGALLVHDNTYTGLVHGVITLQPYRAFQNFGSPYFGATGNNSWDSNDTHGAYATGTHTGSNNSLTVVDQNANWTANQWVSPGVAYEVVNNRTGLNSFATSNTNNTLTLAQNSSQYVYFNTGDGYTIYKLLVALDQPGRGKGDLLSGASPTPAWPNNALEPVYGWNNTVQNPNYPDPSGGYITGRGSLLQGRDYYNGVSMPGYTPYTYPHPLVSGVPASPTNLRIVN